MDETLASGDVDVNSHAFCKFLAALGDYSVNHLATHLDAPQVQTFMRLLLGYTGLPGWFGVDEDDSDTCLPFWYLLQEALWNADFGDQPHIPQMSVAHQLYTEVVDVLRRKVTWPNAAQLKAWTKGQSNCMALNVLIVSCRSTR